MKSYQVISSEKKPSITMESVNLLNSPVIIGVTETNGKTTPPNSSENKLNENNSSVSLALYDVIKDLCQNNIAFYENDETSKGQRLHGAFVGIIDHVNCLIPLVTKVQVFACECDLDENTPGNGYRSFLYVTDCAVKHGIKMCRYVMENRNSLLFRKGIYMKEIESCNHLLASLVQCLTHLLTIYGWCDKGSLFPREEGHTTEELLKDAEAINQYCFYGRALGFQFYESFRPVLKFITICMAGFSEAYYSNGGKIAKATSSMWTSGKYFMDPELRARRIVNISQNSSVDFCKSFWFLAESELMHTLPSFMGTQLKVNKIIMIPPEPLQIANEKTCELVDIPIPMSFFGPAPVSARLLSATRREGIVVDTPNCHKKTMHAMSDNLIFHCHGGGFVAQSSKSHEVYLKDWVIKLNVPILSIDYSLAPEAPFPRAHEEVFFAYCWALQNAHLLGWTGKAIVLAGDSAGANLCLGLTIKAIELGIRKPDGIFMAYAPTVISFTPSPARLLCLMDPLLPFGFLMRCIKAYACADSTKLVGKGTEQLIKISDLKRATSVTTSRTSHHPSLSAVSEIKEDDDNLDSSHTQSDKLVNGGGGVNVTNVETPSDESDSFEENSVWEHVQASESDMQHLQAIKSPISDATSDTLAGESFRSTTAGGCCGGGDTLDIVTPDETNGITFEEDEVPIKREKMEEISDDEREVYGPLTAAEILELNPCMEGTENEQQSNQYVNEFIERYVLDTKVDSEGNTHPVLRNISRTQSEENIIFDIGRETITVQNIQDKIQKVAGNLAEAVSSTINTITTSNPIREIPNQYDDNSCLNSLIARSPTHDIFYEVPKDPYLSPYYASDDILREMPKVRCITVILDPCLDDCVMFGKKLKGLNADMEIDILEGLPHGFLNFTMLSKEAHQASKLCVKRISELFNMNTKSENDSDSKE